MVKVLDVEATTSKVLSTVPNENTRSQNITENSQNVTHTASGFDRKTLAQLKR